MKKKYIIPESKIYALRGIQHLCTLSNPEINKDTHDETVEPGDGQYGRENGLSNSNNIWSEEW